MLGYVFVLQITLTVDYQRRHINYPDSRIYGTIDVAPLFLSSLESTYTMISKNMETIEFALTEIDKRKSITFGSIDIFWKVE